MNKMKIVLLGVMCCTSVLMTGCMMGDKWWLPAAPAAEAAAPAAEAAAPAAEAAAPAEAADNTCATACEYGNGDEDFDSSQGSSNAAVGHHPDATPALTQASENAQINQSTDDSATRATQEAETQLVGNCSCGSATNDN